MSAVAAVAVLAVGASAFAQDVTKYVRYEHDGATSYGILEGETIHQLGGNVFESPERTGATVALGDVTLLPPSEPQKVVAARAELPQPPRRRAAGRVPRPVRQARHVADRT